MWAILMMFLWDNHGETQWCLPKTSLEISFWSSVDFWWPKHVKSPFCLVKSIIFLLKSKFQFVKVCEFPWISCFFLEKSQGFVWMSRLWPGPSLDPSLDPGREHSESEPALDRVPSARIRGWYMSFLGDWILDLVDLEPDFFFCKKKKLNTQNKFYISKFYYKRLNVPFFGIGISLETSICWRWTNKHFCWVTWHDVDN